MPIRVLLGNCRLEFDAGAGELSDGSRRVRLRPKTAALLAHLVARSDQAVSRSELLDHVWPNHAVGDHVVTQSVREVRRALAELGAEPALLETVPKRGYRLNTRPTAVQPRPAGAVVAAVLSLVAVALGYAGYHLGGPSHPAQPTAPSAHGAENPESGTPAHDTVPVTALAGEEGFGSISDDGTVIAFVHRRGIQPDDLYVTGPGHANPVRLTRTPHWERSPAVSPDGRRIAYFEYSDQGCAVMVIAAVGGRAKKLADCHPRFLNYADWSPDGEVLVLSGNARDTDDSVLQLIGVDASSGRTIPIDYSREPGKHDFMPRFSPDGRWLAFVRGANPSYELRVMPARGGESVRVGTGSTARNGYDWLPDGGAVVVPSRAGSLGALEFVAMPGGEVMRRLFVPDHPLYVSVAADAGEIIFTTYRQNANIFELDLETDTPPRMVQESSAIDRLPAYAPDGERYAFVSFRSGRGNLWLMQPGTDRPVMLTDLDEGAAVNPTWSPDGRKILFVHVTDEHRQLKLLDLDANRLSEVTPRDESVLSGVFSSDGQHIYYDSDRNGERGIWRLELSGATPTPLAQGQFPRSVPGEPYVYFVRSGRAGLWRLEPDSREVVRLYEQASPTAPYSWSLAKNRLLFLQAPDDGGIGLYQASDGAQHPPRRLYSLDSVTFDSGFSLAPDGRRVLIALSEHRDSDIVRIMPSEVRLASRPP